MRQRDFGLILSIGILVFLAVFSPKKILIVKGYTVTAEELEHGQAVYERFCSTCHASGRNGAPVLGDAEEWKDRLAKGIERVIANAALNCRPKEEFAKEKVAMATAYMIAESRRRDDSG